MPTGSGNTYQDEDGLLLVLKENATTCTITDDAENVRTFNRINGQPNGTVSGWYLKSISDINQNCLSFSVNANYHPIAINLIPKNGTPIEQLRIVYDNNYNPSIIWNPTSNEAVILRYSTTYNGAISLSGGNYLRTLYRLHSDVTMSESAWSNVAATTYIYNAANVVVDAQAEYNYNPNGLL